MVTKAPINKEENDMTLKKFGALLLAGAMMTGTIGVMSPTQVKAVTPANTYTMTVPANVNIQNSGWNALGDIKITGPVDTGKKVTVTASTTNNFALKNGDNSVSYTLKKAANDTNTTTSFEFDAASINTEDGASQAIGVDVEDFAGTPAGTYTDTIQFTGTMSEGLLWSDNELMEVSLKTNDNKYALIFKLYGLKGGDIIYTKRTNGAPTSKHATLQISGNVFTFICDDVEFELDFSNRKYKFIKNDSEYNWVYIVHGKANGESDYWVKNY